MSEETIQLPQPPKGWVFTTADASLEDRCTVLFKRDREGTERWLTLSAEGQEMIPLYAIGSGPTLAHAWKNACDLARTAVPIAIVTEISSAGGAS